MKAARALSTVALILLSMFAVAVGIAIGLSRATYALTDSHGFSMVVATVIPWFVVAALWIPAVRRIERVLSRVWDMEGA